MIGNLNIANSNRKDTNIKFTKDQEIAVHELIEFLAQPWDDKNSTSFMCRSSTTYNTTRPFAIINNIFNNKCLTCTSSTTKSINIFLIIVWF